MKDIVRLREAPLRRNRQSLPVLRVRVILSNRDYEKVLGKPMKNDFELPEWSVREAITNAVVHRSYVECSSVQVALYDNCLSR